MLGEHKGYVSTAKQLKFTNRWPDNSITFRMYGRTFDIAKDYQDALSGQINLPVIDIAPGSGDYLVLGRGKECGGFLWEVDKRDVLLFIPISVLKEYHWQQHLHMLCQLHPELRPADIEASLQLLKRTTGIDLKTLFM
jgi:hypothetical protein